MRTPRRIRVGVWGLLLLGGALAALPVGFAAATPPPEYLPPMDRLDLNAASRAEIEALPIPPEIAAAIYEHRENLGYFREFFDLWEVEGMTPETMAKLRGLVSTVEPPRRDEALERYDESFRQVERFLSQEGASEELADELLDALRDPQDLNDLSLYELQSFQNISPVDAVAIVKGRKRLGAIEDQRQLRNLEGLSYWGFRSLRDFVEYEKPERNLNLHGDLQFISFNTPYSRGGDETDIISEAFLNAATDRLTGANPAVLTKLRLRLGNDLKGGIMTWRDVAEDDFAETVKGYVTWRPTGGSVGVNKVVLGNYRVAFGQGLVMDNTDFFLPRKTGFGWNKRPQTIYGDLGRSNTFALQGGAMEVSAGPVTAIGFVSHGKKDGVANYETGPDGVERLVSYNRYIVMSPRFEQEILDADNDGFTAKLEREVIDETLFGGNVKLELFPGTYVGLSGYEAQYEKPFDPQVTSLFARPDLLQARDSELYLDYSSEGIGNFRRVVGTEFQAVYENVSLQGEYAKLDSNRDGNFLNQAPEAWIVNGYVQYGDFNLLALYRDYDIGFDNPYARAFSNDTRYEQTLLGDPFRLNNELFSYLAANTPQMKPERGLFLSTRYRISRNLTITGLDYDRWTRVADGQDMNRYTLRMEYAPIWPLRFRLRQRFSSRGEQIENDVRRFRSWDTRLEARVRLSGFDELRVLYSATNTEFAPRPRLSETPSGGDSSLPQGASPGQALQAQYRHNVNDNLMITFSSLVYDGFLWNFEDNEFVLLDGTGFRNWMMIRSRISDNLLMRFKFTTDRLASKSSVLFDRGVTGGDEVRGQETSFRLQLDYTF